MTADAIALHGGLRRLLTTAIAGNCIMRELKKKSNFVFCHAYPETFEVGLVGLPFEALLHLITSTLEKITTMPMRC